TWRGSALYTCEFAMRLLPLMRRLVWLRPLPLVALAAYAMAKRHADVDASAPTRSDAIVEALAARGLQCTTHDVSWLDAAHAIARAHQGSDPNDLYAVDLRVSPEGVPLEVRGVYDLTRTSSVDEESVHLKGSTLAYVAAAGDLRTAIHVVDLAGRDVDTYSDF